jgi:(2Fe-2S) ferredoxin
LKVVDVRRQSLSLTDEVPKVKDKQFCDPMSGKACVTVCASKGSCKRGCKEVREALVEEIARLKLGITVGNAKAGCDGNCETGPILGFPQRQFFYLGVKPADVAEIVQETLMHGRIMTPFVSIRPERAYRTDIYFDKHSGQLVAMDDSICMVEVAKYFLDFEAGLSCGKCIPCRLGLVRMRECIDRIASGKGTMDDLEQIKVLCTTMIVTPYCEFAMTSSRPVLTAVTCFKDEFVSHIEQKECAVGACQGLVPLLAERTVAA